MDKMTIPIGPQHPLLKEPLRLNIEISGEQVLGSVLRLGYVHRGIEKLAQTRNYHQNVPLIERVCGICSYVHTTTYCRAVEALLDLEIPERAHFIRALMIELERVHSHLLWLGILAKHIGLDMVFMHTMHDRESILDIMEALSGGRIAHAVNQIGGVRFDIKKEHGAMIAATVKKLNEEYEELLDILEHEPSLKARTKGVAPISAEDAKKFCVVGPVARASGIDVDMRRDDPMPPYDQLEFQVITHVDGDAWARTYVRLQEIRQSLHLCDQIIDKISEGPTSVRARRKVPPGEVVMRSEAPRGEVFYYLRSDGSEYPARLKIRTPTLPVLGILPQELSEIHVADIPVVLAGVDLCVACADR